MKFYILPATLRTNRKHHRANHRAKASGMNKMPGDPRTSKSFRESALVLALGGTRRVDGLRLKPPICSIRAYHWAPLRRGCSENVLRLHVAPEVLCLCTQVPVLRLPLLDASSRLASGLGRVGHALGARPAVEQRSADAQLGAYLGDIEAARTPQLQGLLFVLIGVSRPLASRLA